jgi:hypothetical protein
LWAILTRTQSLLLLSSYANLRALKVRAGNKCPSSGLIDVYSEPNLPPTSTRLDETTQLSSQHSAAPPPSHGRHQDLLPPRPRPQTEHRRRPSPSHPAPPRQHQPRRSAPRRQHPWRLRLRTPRRHPRHKINPQTRQPRRHLHRPPARRNPSRARRPAYGAAQVRELANYQPERQRFWS